MGEQPSTGVSLNEFLRTTKAVREGKGWLAHCPGHDDKKRSLSINLGSRGDGTSTVLVFCHVCGTNTFPQLKSLGYWPIRPPNAAEAKLAIMSSPQADQHPDHVWVPVGEGEPPVPSCPAGYRVAGVWTYRDVEGRIIGLVSRFDNIIDPPPGKKRDKFFLPTFFFKKSVVGGEEDVWLHKMPSSDVDAKYPVRPLYGLWKLKDKPNEPILLVEGEKTAEAAQKLFPTYVSLSPMGGLQGFSKTDLSPLADRTVVIWPDNDETWLTNIAVWAARLHVCKKLLHVKLPDELPPKWDLADEAPSGVDLYAILDSAVDYGNKSFQVLMTIKEAADLIKYFYAVKVNEGTVRYIFALNGTELGQETFDQHFKHITQVVGSNKPSAWFVASDQGKVRTCFGGKVSIPNGAELIKTSSGEYAYNVYRPSEMKPRKGNIDPWLSHLDWLLNEQDRTELICRLANLVQRPNKRPLSMYLLIGPQRVGKTMIFDAMRDIVGGQNYVAINPGELIENYNSLFVDRLMVVCNELFEHNKTTFYEKIKSLITDQYVTRKEKYHSDLSVPNYMHFFATTNHSVAVTLPDDREGRFYVAQCLPKEPRPHQYYKDFYAWKASNLPCLLDFLQNYDLEDWDPEHRPIVTDAKKAMAAGGLPAFEREYVHLLVDKLEPLSQDLFTGMMLANKLYECGALRRASDKQTLRTLVEKYGGSVHTAMRKSNDISTSIEMMSVRNSDYYRTLGQEQLWQIFTNQGFKGVGSI
jgi:hypothetical protein